MPGWPSQIAQGVRRAIARARGLPFDPDASRRAAFLRGDDDRYYSQLSEILSLASGGSMPVGDSMRLTTVFACVRIIAGSIAQIPLHLYERQGESRKRRAVNHNLYRILHDQPNDRQSRHEYIELMLTWLLLRGNAYALILRDSFRQVAALQPIHPDRVKINPLPNDSFEYEVKSAFDPTKKTIYSANKILHLRGLSDDGLTGLSPISAARDAVGLGLAAESYGARFFKNNARPGIAFELPQGVRMKPEDKKAMVEAWVAEYSGGNQLRPAVLDQGMTLKTYGVPPEDAQFLETRKFQVEEIARIFGVPLHMLNAMEKSTSWGSGLEQQAIGFVTYTLGPWIAKLESAFALALLDENERNQYFCEFLTDALVRGDIQSRYGAYATARQWGWLSVNDIRDRENMNPVEDGDVYLQPLNMMPAGTEPAPPVERNPREPVGIGGNGNGNRGRAD